MARERLVHRPFVKLGGRACRPPGARACVSLRAGLGGWQDACLSRGTCASVRARVSACAWLRSHPHGLSTKAGTTEEPHTVAVVVLRCPSGQRPRETPWWRPAEPRLPQWTLPALGALPPAPPCCVLFCRSERDRDTARRGQSPSPAPGPWGAGRCRRGSRGPRLQGSEASGRLRGPRVGIEDTCL